MSALTHRHQVTNASPSLLFNTTRCSASASSLHCSVTGEPIWSVTLSLSVKMHLSYLVPYILTRVPSPNVVVIAYLQSGSCSPVEVAKDTELKTCAAHANAKTPV